MAMYEEEKQSYIDKLGRQILTLGQILSIESCGLITSEVRGRLEDLKRKAQNYKRKLEKNEFEIAIVGLEKAGKSTFANALMGNDILPSKEERCTYTSTRICSSDDGKDTAVVEFFSRKEFDEKFRGQLAQMGIEIKDDDSFDRMTLSQYTKRYEELDAEKKKLYGNNINQDVEDSLRNKDNLSMFIGSENRTFSGKSELASKELKRFIEDPAYALAVKNISIMSTQLSGMPNAVIYDVPGFDSPTQIHREQTVREMRKVDAVILVVSADKPSFTAPSVDLFQNNTDDYGLKFEDKIFVFANRADLATEFQKNMDKIQSELRRYGIMNNPSPERLVPGSAKTALFNDEQAKAKLQSLGIDDGIAKIKKRLEDYNKTERFAVLKRRIEKIQDELSEEIKKLEDDLGGDDTSAGFIAQGYSKIAFELSGKKEGIKKKLNDYFNEVKGTEISSEVKEKVVEQISVEKGGVTDSEYEAVNAEVQAGGVGNAAAPTTVEDRLRKKKKDVLYKKFTEGIVGLSNEKHQSVDAKYVEIFMEELGITQSNSNYDGLRNNVVQFIDSQKSTSDETGYYRSLIERFSVDLFEAMISRILGSPDRWLRFDADKATFKTLELFDENKEKNENAISVCDLVLYQDCSDSESTKESEHHSGLNENGHRLLSAIKSASNIVPGGDVLKMILNVQDDAEKVGNLLNVLSGRKDVPVSKIMNTLSNLVKGKTNKEEKTDVAGEDSNDRYSKSYYDSYFLGKLDRNKEEIINVINTDIQNLHDVLDSSVIKAINIEKAFTSLLIVNKDRIISALDGKPYEEFIQKNQSLICSSEYQGLEIEQQRRMTKKAVLGNIKRLYEELAQEKPVDMVS